MRSAIFACAALCAVALSGHVCRVAFADDTAGAGIKTCDIMLNHATPSDVIALLHWNDPKMRPAGVTSVTANTADNSLHVVATKEGLAQVEDLVSDVDVPVRQILVNVSEVLAAKSEVDAYGIAENPANRKPRANSDFLYTANGKLVARMLADLTAKGNVIGSPAITTTNNTPAILTFTSTSSNLAHPEVSSCTIKISPRANSDSTVTLPITIVQSAGPEQKSQMFTVTRTVPDGQTFVAGYAASDSSSAKNKLVLYFVTPHLLDMK